MESKDRESIFSVFPPDSSPSIGGMVRRTYGGRRRSVPVVKQSTFIVKDDGQIDLSAELQANTCSGLRILPPVDYVIQSTEGSIDPAIARKALRQQAAIVRNTKNARNGKRKL